ncbi:hypothetical protein B0H21DRAFT_841935 [Amylocystis lapponica]|nr:hypothetical protein B0H21DRAFT_841935 [Amylocystis lapponica]
MVPTRCKIVQTNSPLEGILQALDLRLEQCLVLQYHSQDIIKGFLARVGCKHIPLSNAKFPISEDIASGNGNGQLEHIPLSNAKFVISEDIASGNGNGQLEHIPLSNAKFVISEDIASGNGNGQLEHIPLSNAKFVISEDIASGNGNGQLEHIPLSNAKFVISEDIASGNGNGQLEHIPLPNAKLLPLPVTCSESVHLHTSPISLAYFVKNKRVLLSPKKAGAKLQSFLW